MKKLYFRNKRTTGATAPMARAHNKKTRITEMTLQRKHLAGQRVVVVDFWAYRMGKNPPVRLVLRPQDANKIADALTEMALKVST